LALTFFVDGGRDEIFPSASFAADQDGNVFGGSFHDVLNHRPHSQSKR
jgi:hypothetical protein